MKKSKLVLSLGILLAVVLLVAACGNGNNDSAPAVPDTPATDAPATDTPAVDAPEADAPADTPAADADGFDWRAFDGSDITIGIWWGNETEEASLRAVIDSFEALTGIAVSARTYEDYQTQLLTELAGGMAPDVFYVEAMLAPTFIEQGVLANLNPFIAETPNFNQADFYTPAIDAFMANGEVFGLPKDLSTLGLLYNIELLEYAGFTSDDIPDTMTELAEFLRQLQPNLPAGVIAGVTSPELARHMFVLGTILDANGTVQLAGPGQLDYLETHVELFQDGIIQRAGDLGAGWSGDAFGLESVALMIEGNWVLGHLNNNFPDVNFGTRELPTMNGQNGSMMFTVAWGVNSASDNLGAAWLFTYYLTSTQGMADWAGPVGVIPSRASSSDLLNLGGNPILAPFVAAAAYATPWQNGIELPIIMHHYNDLFPAVLAGDMSLQEAMELATERSNNEIELHLR